MKYRAEIDGLRALAVLPVILFHANFSFARRGFLGVDVFFVISGFLITSIILSDLQKGHFSFARFYERRIRRIIPALFTVLLVCIPFAYFLLFPGELKNFANSLISSVLFCANFFFYFLLDGYFAPEASKQPLLHIWTLAVEEQFYIILPFLLIVLFRFSKKIQITAVAALSFASLVLCLTIGREYQVMSFYMLPTRFWELAAGALLAITALDRKTYSERTLNILAWTGLLLIIYSYTLVPKKEVFPGWATIPIIAGTVLILGFARRETAVGKFLSSKPLVFIGMISYSAYLWHQPVFVFFNLYFDVPRAAYVGLIILTLVLSVITWHFIEQPFRKRSTQSNYLKVFSAAFIFGAIIISIGAALPFLYTFSPYRIDNPYTKTPDIAYKNYTCSASYEEQSNCIYGNNPDILLIGDSFGKHIAPALMASQSALPFLQRTMAACPPLFNYADTTSSSRTSKRCLQFQDGFEAFIQSHPEIKYVIISTAISYYYKHEPMLTHHGIVRSTPEITTKRLRQMLTWFLSYNIKPVIISPPPRNGKNPNDCIQRALRRRADIDRCNINVSDLIDYKNGSYDLLANISDLAPVIYLDQLLCEKEACPILSNGFPVYGDKSHLSIIGSHEIGKRTDLFSKVKKAMTGFHYPHITDISAY